jgi:hypothetical protein
MVVVCDSYVFDGQVGEHFYNLLFCVVDIGSGLVRETSVVAIVSTDEHIEFTVLHGLFDTVGYDLPVSSDVSGQIKSDPHL